MAAEILTAEQEEGLLEPIRAHVDEIQRKIDELRADGATRVDELHAYIQQIKSDKLHSKEEADRLVAEAEQELVEARKVKTGNKAEVEKLVAEAESYLKAHYEPEYLSKVRASAVVERAQAKSAYEERLEQIKAEHEAAVKSIGGADAKQELHDENYVYKNRQFDAKLIYKQQLAAIKDRVHAAFIEQYHYIDLLRRSKFTFLQSLHQRVENYKYSFDTRQFLLKNGLYIVIVLIFIGLGIFAPIVKNVDLFTSQNILNILQQASPRMFLALGVAGLILLTGTDLSIGRMVGMGMVVATVIMHKGPNTGGVFGHVFDFSETSIVARTFFALIACIVACTIFTTIAGFFTARFKMHPFISTMANMLIIFGLVTYATKGVSFGAIENEIPNMIVPKVNGFPTIILWAVAAIIVVWFIWNKTRFGKNLYAVGGNPEAASVSGISVFKVTLGAFVMAGILYGFGTWLECARMFGSGSAAYGQGWDMDAIAACVVGGVSFTGGIGKISGVVVGVLIFTGLTYSLTILGIDTNLQFVFSGIIILAAVTLDSLKYVQKK